MKRKNNLLYLKDIYDSIEKALTFIADFNYKDFIKDEKTQFAVIRAREIIGEASKKINSDLKKKYSDIPWKEMSGMRDILIHEYFGINSKIVWKTLKEDLPPLKEKIKNMMEDFDQNQFKL